MKIKVNIENLISLVSNLLIRLRQEEFSSSGSLKQDIIIFAEYLEKYSKGDEEVLFDNNFITSHDEKEKLNKIFKINSEEIKNFRKAISDLEKDNSSSEKLEEAKEHLRKIAASLMSLKK